MAASNTHAAKKMVMKPCYRTQLEKPRKGKGAYTRKPKHAKAGPSGLFCRAVTVFNVIYPSWRCGHS